MCGSATKSKPYAIKIIFFLGGFLMDKAKKSYTYQDVEEDEIKLFGTFKMPSPPQPQNKISWEYYQFCFDTIFASQNKKTPS